MANRRNHHPHTHHPHAQQQAHPVQPHAEAHAASSAYHKLNVADRAMVDGEIERRLLHNLPTRATGEQTNAHNGFGTMLLRVGIPGGTELFPMVNQEQSALTRTIEGLRSQLSRPGEIRRLQESGFAINMEATDRVNRYEHGGVSSNPNVHLPNPGGTRNPSGRT